MEEEAALVLNKYTAILLTNYANLCPNRKNKLWTLSPFWPKISAHVMCPSKLLTWYDDSHVCKAPFHLQLFSLCLPTKHQSIYQPETVDLPFNHWRTYWLVISGNGIERLVWLITCLLICLWRLPKISSTTWLCNWVNMPHVLLFRVVCALFREFSQ